MSTEFVSASDAAMDDWDATAFVRWSRRGGTAFEFGTVTNFEQVRSLLGLGEWFVGLGDGELTTVDQLDSLLLEDRVTFGEFPVTVALGSGTMFRFTVEE
jgi:hypothetical protein